MLLNKSKLPNVGNTIFTEMSQLALQHNAINLGQGFPDFPMNQELIALVNKAMQDGYNQYAHSDGLPLLRERIAEKIKFLYNTSVDYNKEIIVTPGGTYAIYTSLTAVLNIGDEVIVFEPAYDSYIPAIEVNGAKAVTIPLSFPNYKIDWSEVKNRINSRTKMIMINSPQNPTGTILTGNDIKELINITQGTNILILSDEVYEHLIYDNEKHESILKYPELKERSFVCFSFGKVFNCTGWKLGYCVAPEMLMKEFRKIHQFNCFSCFTPSQIAIAEYLQKKETYLSLSNQLQTKRDYLRELLSDTLFTPIPSKGSYFECYDYSQLSHDDEKTFAVRLTKSVGVAGIPVSAFYKTPVNNHVIRFCFAKKNETLEIAAERLKNAAKKL
ncbi:MAG: methionine aminotransferase [Arachidicoccus sp.]|nr:methionine aminotransferase [Arachidicoccus sp.]